MPPGADTKKPVKKGTAVRKRADSQDQLSDLAEEVKISINDCFISLGLKPDAFKPELRSAVQ